MGRLIFIRLAGIFGIAARHQRFSLARTRESHNLSATVFGPMPRRASKDISAITTRQGAANRRLSRRQRERKLTARTLHGNPSPLLIPVTQLYAWVGWIFLLPACLITGRTVLASLSTSLSGDYWRTAPFWFFTMGLIMWLIWFLFLPRPLRLYVWGHEMTHALCVLLCGGKVKEFRVSEAGGHVITDRNNILIALSPYFFPLYTVAGVLLFLLTGLVVDLSIELPLPWGGGVRPVYLLFWFIGVTWGFHLAFTIWMIARDQPDLKINGTFFSLTVIILLNLLVVALLLILAVPGLSIAGFFQHWVDFGWNMLHSLWMAVKTLGGHLK